MSPQPHHVPLQGSHREAYRNAKAAGPCNPDERLEVTVVVRPRQPLDHQALLSPYDPNRADGAAGPRAALSRTQFAETHGASPDDLRRVAAFAREHNLTVVRCDAARRSVALGGTVRDFGAAFGVDLQHFEYDEGTYRGRTGSVHVPADLADVVEAVLGLDDRPQARLHLRPHSGAAP